MSEWPFRIPDYGWPRTSCPECGREVAVHPSPSGAWFVKHKVATSDTYGRLASYSRCPASGRNALAALDIPLSDFTSWLDRAGLPPRRDVSRDVKPDADA
jgi:hypothetical protein